MSAPNVKISKIIHYHIGSDGGIAVRGSGGIGICNTTCINGDAWSGASNAGDGTAVVSGGIKIAVDAGAGVKILMKFNAIIVHCRTRVRPGVKIRVARVRKCVRVCRRRCPGRRRKIALLAGVIYSRSVSAGGGLVSCRHGSSIPDIHIIQFRSDTAIRGA